jgi:hypothetical protein
LQLGGLFDAGICSDDHFTVYVHLCHLISILFTRSNKLFFNILFPFVHLKKFKSGKKVLRDI